MTRPPCKWLSATLVPYGFEITNISNDDEAVDWARKNLPALIIVSVEPKKVGYAICNKLKRSADLKGIPLILTSADEAPPSSSSTRRSSCMPMSTSSSRSMLKSFVARWIS